MARILRAQSKSFRIDRWLGLNESMDGDSGLKYGEATVAHDWRITRDGILRRRPGTKTVATLTESYDGDIEVRCLWSGRVASNEVLLAIADNALWLLSGTAYSMEKTKLGPLNANGKCSIFGWDAKAYILTGNEYKVWDGNSLSDVEGYIPLVSVSVLPGGGGTLLEQVNKLSPNRRVWFSPDGTAKTFQLPETGLATISRVTNRSTGEDYTAGTDYSVDTLAGTVTFAAAPGQAVNDIEVEYAVAADLSSEVTGMRFAELYNGTGDNRVFLYGDGSNELIYSGIDYNGNPRADYFPDLNEIAVGTANTPVTGCIKHYSRLLVFKPSESYTVAYSTTTLADGSVTSVFYLTPVNRSLGNDAMGQVQLVLNSARSFCAGAVYEWRNNSSYTANLTVDERQARRISERVNRSLDTFTTNDTVCWDDNLAQEYYMVCNGMAVIHNYAADVWYTYLKFPAKSFARFGGELYIGDNKGHLLHVSDRYDDDDGRPINAYWESGSIDFGAYTRQKYFAELWMDVAPVGTGEFSVMAKTDRERAREAVITTPTAGETFDFGTLDFSSLSFDYDRISLTRHLRMRIRKFTFAKIIFQADATDAKATVASVALNVVYGGESRQR